MVGSGWLMKIYETFSEENLLMERQDHFCFSQSRSATRWGKKNVVHNNFKDTLPKPLTFPKGAFRGFHRKGCKTKVPSGTLGGQTVG